MVKEDYHGADKAVVRLLCWKNVNLFNNAKNYVPINPLTAEWALRAIIDFTLSNARWFYSSMGNPLDGKGLTTPKTMSPLTP